MSWDTDLLSSRARITPSRVAVISGETSEQWTYEQMNTRADLVAVALRNEGVKIGDRIALFSPNDVYYLDLFFACMKIGAIFVPLNWRLSEHEIEYILEDCSPSFLFYAPLLKGALPADLSYKQVECGGRQYLNWLKATCKFEKEYLRMDDPLAIIYTGGTTGKPKGVVLSHRSIFCNTINTIHSWNITADDITLTYMPMFHTGGLNVLTLPILHMGGQVVIGNKFEPIKALQQINQYAVTIAIFVPTMYHMMIHTKEFETMSFTSMHTFLSGGAPCSYQIYEAFAKKDLQFKEGYGLTEAGPNNFYIESKVAMLKKGSVGKPMLYNQVKLVDENGHEVDRGEVGELTIRGYHVFHYYWNKPDETKEALKNGWLFTGDLARQDDDGYFYIVGRKKDMIISGGENIYPLEIEHALAEHPDVIEVAVVGCHDDKWGERVTAFITLQEEAELSEEEMRHFCKNVLAMYKIPKRFIFVAEIPKTPVGKIDKVALIQEAETAS